jgi:hypothetical protein
MIRIKFEEDGLQKTSISQNDNLYEKILSAKTVSESNFKELHKYSSFKIARSENDGLTTHYLFPNTGHEITISYTNNPKERNSGSLFIKETFDVKLNYWYHISESELQNPLIIVSDKAEIIGTNQLIGDVFGHYKE